MKYWNEDVGTSDLLSCTFDSVLDGTGMAGIGRGNCLPRIEGPPTIRSNNPSNDDNQNMLRINENNYVVEWNPSYESFDQSVLLTRYAEHEPFYSSTTFSWV